MKTELLKWCDCDAVKYTVEEKELIIGVSAGPRIPSARFKGNKNLLHIDKTDFKVDNWRMYGGRLFTVSPESPESYYADNDSCKVEIRNNKLIVTSPKRPNGIQLSIQLSQEPERKDIKIIHNLYNHSDTVWIGAIRAITCVPRYSRVFAYCETNKVNLWEGSIPSIWYMNNKYIRIKNGSFGGKIGWHTQNPELIFVQEHGVLAVYRNCGSRPNECVDKGSNVEIFACKNYIELETLSKKIELLPKKSAVHLQRWQLFESSNSPWNSML